jgi:FkbM family methyltransferase
MPLTKSVFIYFLNSFRATHFKLIGRNVECNFTLRKNSSDLKLFAETFFRYFPDDFYALLKNDSHFYNDNSLILDIGACNGSTSVLFRDFFPAQQIVAVESDPKNFRMLCENTKDLRNISCFNFALDSQHSKVITIDSNQGFWGLQTAQANHESSDTIICKSVRQLIPERFSNLNRFLIKLDIEGGERFLDTRDWDDIASFEVICVEFHDWLFPDLCLSRNFWKALTERNENFSLYIRGNNIWVIKK